MDCYVSTTVLSILYISHSILTTNWWGQCYCYHFAGHEPYRFSILCKVLKIDDLRNKSRPSEDKVNASNHKNTSFSTHCRIQCKYYSAIKKNEIMPIAATWMDLEIVILSEVSQTQRRNIIWHPLYVESKMIQMNLFTKQK